MSDFEPAVEVVLKNEGVICSSNPLDNGGITKFGISFRLLKSLSSEDLRECGIDFPVQEDDVRYMTVDQAKKVYKLVFWDKFRFSEIESQPVCNYIFDMAINMGASSAIKCAQRATWAINLNQFRDRIADDGVYGSITLNAINSKSTVILGLMCAMKAERGNYYRNLIIKNPQKKEFLNGWLNRTYNT